MNDVEKRRTLMSGVLDAARRAQRSRIGRGLAQPFQTVAVKLLRSTGRVREVSAATFFGSRMTVVIPEPVSTSIWRYGFVEEDVCLFLIAALGRGGRFVDVGAHLGFFTQLGACLAGERGRVLALEPTPSTHQVLIRNVVAYPQVAVHPYAAFSENCQITFHDYGVALSAFNSALTIRMTGDRVAPPHTEIMVTARRIDDLLAEMGWNGVDVIKIDAESSEAHVLFGLERTIRESHPAVIAEMGDYGVEGSLRSRQMIDWFTARGYAVCEAAGALIVPHHPRQDYGHENLLFLTDEHRERLRNHGF